MEIKNNQVSMKHRRVEITIDGAVWKQRDKGVREEFLFIVEVDENESIENVITELRQVTSQAVGKTCFQLSNEIDKLKDEVEWLDKQISRAKTKWNRTKEFLVAQQIKSSPEDMPVFASSRLLKPQSQESKNNENS